jgi:hypothetical protein
MFRKMILTLIAFSIFVFTPCQFGFAQKGGEKAGQAARVAAEKAKEAAKKAAEASKRAAERTKKEAQAFKKGWQEQDKKMKTGRK